MKLIGNAFSVYAARVLVAARFIQQEEKSNIVREDDDLPVLRFSSETLGETIPMQMVEGGDGIVKDQRGPAVCGRELGHKSGKSDAAVFSLTEYVANPHLRLLDERHTEERSAVCRLFLA